MSGYIGARCPVCDKKFVNDDDIVVCPTCGAPHHRDCYSELGHCAFEKEHITGKPWKSEVEETVSSSQTLPNGDYCINPSDGKEWDSASADAKICPFCQHKNPKDNLFCCSCGQRLLPTAQANAKPTGNTTMPPFGGFVNMDPTVALYGGVSPGERIGNHSARDVATFVGRSSSYYLPRFKAEQEARRTKNSTRTFTLSAFFLSFYYFFYRKMYKIGIIALVATLLLAVPQVLLASELLPEVLQENFTEEQLEDIGIQLDSFPEVNQQRARVLNVVSQIAGIVNVVMRAFLGFYAVRLYFEHTMKRMDKIRQQTDSELAAGTSLEGFESRIQKAGDVNIVLVVLLVLAPTIITTISTLLLLLL